MNAESVYPKAWAHFELIAKQRISTFNFYLIILGALLAAFFSFDPQKNPSYSFILLGACNVLAPIAFFLIDCRIRRLLRNLKDTLFAIETWPEWNPAFRPFHRDADESKKCRNRLASYSVVFTGVFAFHFLFGCGLLWFAIWGNASHAPAKAPQGATVVWQKDRI